VLASEVEGMVASEGDGNGLPSSSDSLVKMGIATTNGRQRTAFTDHATVVRNSLRELSEEDKLAVMEDCIRDCNIHNLEKLATFIGKMRVSRSEIKFDGFVDPFTILPHPIILKVLSFLDPVSLCRGMRVSRLWLRLSTNSSLWKDLCNRSKDYRMCSLAAEKQQIAKFTQDGTVRWQEAFGERFRLWNNWHSGRCTVRTLYGHREGVACVQFEGDRVVSGSSDTTIRCWNLKQEGGTGLLEHTLHGHSETVRCLHLVKNRLASGSNDFTIKIWDMERSDGWSSMGCRRTMIGHNNHVRCLEMGEQNMISGSYDSSLKLWSLETGECVRTLVGHADAVLCEQYREEENVAVSGSSDKCIKTWDTRTNINVMSIHHAHDSAVTCIRMDDQRILSGSLDRMIKMWDVRTGRLLKTIDWRMAEGHTGVVRCLQADSWRIVSSADDRTVKVWNLESGERLCTLRDHQDGVTCLQFNDERIVSGSYDKTVKVWDFTLC
ncbi:hypothetical protein PRIPAC_77802, partial [Pristionchus pacificus]|uniref:F-box domain-containing protein n=1 Tax=Pristionchus pacificus TaxID=54126 RepID=A0A8R1V4U1_PRIPA